MGIFGWLHRKREKAEEKVHTEKMQDNVQALLLALGDPKTRWEAITALEYIKEHTEKMQDNVPALLLALRDPETRWEATTALGYIGDARAIGPLVEASIDVDPRIRGAAAIALGRIGDERVVKPLVRFLNFEEGVAIRLFAIEALGHIGDSTAIAPLTQALKDEDASIRKYAEEALKNIKSKQFGKKEKAKSETNAIKTKFRALLQDLPVIEKENISEYRQKMINRCTPPHPCMFSGSMSETTDFVTKMVHETESYIRSCEGIIWVNKSFLISSLPVSDVLQIQYEQFWDDGSSAIYSEDVMRVGDDQFEVFGSEQSAARMKKKEKGDVPS